MKDHHVWFLSHNFPPEVNALATRTYEHAKVWAQDGCSFDILTDVPHFPEGRIYSGYPNRFYHESLDGISVYRFPIYPAQNRGRIRRTLSYLSFLISVLLLSFRVTKKPTLIVASSPQIFTAFAGFLLSLLYRVPFTMEIRDLWPQSISAVGIMKKSLLLQAIERAVFFLYQRAFRIIVLTESFREELVQQGVPFEKIAFVPNGISRDFAEMSASAVEVESLRVQYGLNGKYVASYIGTLGLAHGVDSILQAARLTANPDIVYLIVGAGAMRERLEKELKAAPLTNVRLLPKVDRKTARALLELSDVLLVLLKNQPLFETVIPSKLLEALGCGRPVILGVRGESARILAACNGGIAISPEDADELAEAVETMAQAPDRFRELAAEARLIITRDYDRAHLARDLWRQLV